MSIQTRNHHDRAPRARPSLSIPGTLISVLALLWGPPVPAAPPSPPIESATVDDRAIERSKAAASAELRSKLATHGVLPVIVKLRADFVREGDVSKSTMIDHELRIRELQDAVLLDLDARKALRSDSVKVYRTYPLLGLQITARELDLLQAHPAVDYVTEDKPSRHPRMPVAPVNVPLKPAWPALSGAKLYDSIGIIGAQDAWNQEYRGFGYAIAIFDDGVGPHPFIPASKIVSEACYSTNAPSLGVRSLCPGGGAESIATGSGRACADCSHGTHVAGIAAGINGASDEGTINGVAPDASIIAIQVFSRDDDGDITSFSSDQIKAMERVKELRSQFNVAAINMSLGSDATFSTTCDTDPRKQVIDDLISLGIATVIASGNDGRPAQTSRPGCISTAITVGSTDKDDDLSSFSNNATWVDLLAPGAAICSSVMDLDFFGNLFTGCGNNDDYAEYDGTSMATPHVAGAWAVLRSRQHGASVGLINTTLLNSGQPISTGIGQKRRIRVGLAAAALSEDTALQTDVPVRNLAWKTSLKLRHFYIDVPAGKPLLYTAMSGGSGDADLFVRFNAKPTLSSFDCRSQALSNTELCNVSNPAAGRWYVSVRPYAEYVGLSLVASFERSSNSLRVESEGDTAVSITSPNSGLGGVTNYVRENIVTGTEITLRAPLNSPDNTKGFAAWTGCDSVSATGGSWCHLTFNSNRTVSARYNNRVRNLRVQTSDAIGVPIDGIPAFVGGMAADFPFYDRTVVINTPVQLFAPPNWYAANFSHWTGCGSVSGAGLRTCSVTMSVNQTVHAVYNNPTFSVAVSTPGASSVPVEGGPTYSGTSNYTRSALSGTTITLSVPLWHAGRQFLAWTGCDRLGVSSTRTCVVTVDGNETLSAQYVVPGPEVFNSGFEGDAEEPPPQ